LQSETLTWPRRPVSVAECTTNVPASSSGGLSSTIRINSFATAHRQRESECGTRPQLALHPDPAPVQLDELPTQGQPQPSAFHLLVRRSHLAELLEHCLLILRGDADPGVADRDLDQPVLWHCAHFDVPTLRRELDRIGQ